MGIPLADVRELGPLSAVVEGPVLIVTGTTAP